MDLKLLSCDSVSKVFREPYIINGYRRTDTSLWQCIKYMFVLHNDFGNFWTHFIPLWIWLYWLYRLSFQLDLTDPYWYPLLAIWISSCLCNLMSSVAHSVGSMSVTVRELSSMLDYHGISLYSFGCLIAYYFYDRPTDNPLYQYKWSYIVFSSIISINATVLSSLSQYYGMKWRYKLTAASFSLPYLLIVSYVLVMLLDYQSHTTLPLHVAATFSSLLAVFFFVSKFPESVMPGKFDYFFHSHQLFHITTVMTMTIQFHIFPIDALARKDRLIEDLYYSPDLYSTMVPLFVVFLSGCFAVAILSSMPRKAKIA